MISGRLSNVLDIFFSKADDIIVSINGQCHCSHLNHLDLQF